MYRANQDKVYYNNELFLTVHKTSSPLNVNEHATVLAKIFNDRAKDLKLEMGGK